MTRPDLDAIERRLKYGYGTVPFGWSTDMEAMLSLCRELEAENKQLREAQVKDLKRYANWLEAAGDCGP